MADGTMFIAGVYGGRLYTYNGATWTEQTPAGVANKNWTCCAISSDGTKFIAPLYYGRFYVYNGSWSEVRPVGDANYDWLSCDMSYDGTEMIAGAFGGRLYKYAGGSWSELTPAGSADKNWYGGVSINKSLDITTSIKSVFGVTQTATKKVNSVTIESVKKLLGVANV